MLKRLSAFAGALTLCMTITASTAQAKSVPKAYTIAVPFDFVVGNRTMPAGTYRFQLVLGSPKGSDTVAVLAVRSEDGRYYASTLTAVTEGEAPTDGPKLVFNRAGGRAALSQIWEQGNPLGLKLSIANRETQLAQGTERVLIPSH
jgi:hypothetical protein